MTPTIQIYLALRDNMSGHTVIHSRSCIEIELISSPLTKFIVYISQRKRAGVIEVW